MTTTSATDPSWAGELLARLRIPAGAWKMTLGAVVGALVGAVIAFAPIPQSASAAVLLQPLERDPLDEEGGRVDVSTEREIASSMLVATAAGRELGQSVSPADLRRRSEVGVRRDALVLEFVVRHTDPAEAARQANSLALAYIRIRSSAVRMAISERRDALENEISSLAAELADADTLILALREDNDGDGFRDASAYEVEQAVQARDALATRRLLAEAELGELVTITVGGGQVISPATTSAVDDEQPLGVVLLGALAGAIAAAVLRRPATQPGEPVRDPQTAGRLLQLDILAVVADPDPEGPFQPGAASRMAFTAAERAIRERAGHVLDHPLVLVPLAGQETAQEVASGLRDTMADSYAIATRAEDSSPDLTWAPSTDGSWRTQRRAGLRSASPFHVHDVRVSGRLDEDPTALAKIPDDSWVVVLVRLAKANRAELVAARRDLTMLPVKRLGVIVIGDRPGPLRQRRLPAALADGGRFVG